MGITSLSSKLTALGWGLLILITVSTYTAGLTAALTSEHYESKIHGLADIAHSSYKVGGGHVGLKGQFGTHR